VLSEHFHSAQINFSSPSDLFRSQDSYHYSHPEVFLWVGELFRCTRYPNR